jgi:amidophosphoribosyltransferase
MFNEIKEECGVFGIYSERPEKSAYITYIGLAGLQHRGEESAGIAVNTDGVITYHKDIGHISDVFTNEVLENLPEGKMSIGHVKYSTKGSMKKENAQPIVIRHKKGNLAVVSNGCITNADELRQELEDDGAIFTTTGATEVICHIIVRERLKAKSSEEAVLNAMKILKGAYSLLIMTPQKLIAVRDPQGFRPLCMGKMGKDIIFASESCALDICGADFVRDVEPGEIVVVQENEIETMKYDNGLPKGMCVFEYVYFSRPDSIVEGLSVHDVREKMGRYLAMQAPVEADVVASVPDSGTDAALRIF